jgi:hypothetical protein
MNCDYSLFFYRLKPLSFVQICSRIMESIPKCEDRVKFVTKIEDKVKHCKESLAFARVLKGGCYLQSGQIVLCKVSE